MKIWLLTSSSIGWLTVTLRWSPSHHKGVVKEVKAGKEARVDLGKEDQELRMTTMITCSTDRVINLSYTPNSLLFSNLLCIL